MSETINLNSYGYNEGNEFTSMYNAANGYQPVATPSEVEYTFAESFFHESGFTSTTQVAQKKYLGNTPNTNGEGTDAPTEWYTVDR